MPKRIFKLFMSSPSRKTMQTLPRSRVVTRVAACVVNVLTAILLLGAFSRAEAAVVNASDCSLAAVQLACAVASSGDTVQVPAGTATWTSHLLVTKNIQLIGAGIGQTIITDNNPDHASGNALIIQWTPVPPSGLCRLSGFSFYSTATNNAYTTASSFEFFGTNDTMRIDHCQFVSLTPGGYGAMRFNDAITGVVDHNLFQWTNYTDYIYIENCSLGGNGAGNSSGRGDVSWASPDYWGTTNMFLYFEDNQFSFAGSIPGFPTWAICDSANGSRFVFRYNNCTNCWLYTHGTESGGRVRGFREAEVYKNTFVAPANTAAAVLPLRSGTGLVWSNTVVGLTGGIVGLADYRAEQNFSPWGGANGLNPWDSNNPSIIATGTHTGTNGAAILMDSNHNWTVNQWATNGYVIVNLTQGGTNYYDYAAHQTFAVAIANDVHTITLNPSVNWGSMLWTNGDAYAIYQLYQTLDQPSAGQGDLIVDTSWGSAIPTNSLGGNWPHQVISPIYQWGNTVNGAVPTIQNGQYGFLVANTNYFDNVAKPGYVPLVYPHPLVSGTNGPTQTNAYVLTVNGGTGNGSYTAGTTVLIAANPVNAQGQAFLNWTGDTSFLTSATAASTTVSMPGNAVTVTANYGTNVNSSVFPPLNLQAHPPATN
jgi:hypothetical protein